MMVDPLSVPKLSSLVHCFEENWLLKKKLMWKEEDEKSLQNKYNLIRREESCLLQPKPPHDTTLFCLLMCTIIINGTFHCHQEPCHTQPTLPWPCLLVGVIVWLNRAGYIINIWLLKKHGDKKELELFIIRNVTDCINTFLKKYYIIQLQWMDL